MKHYEQDYDYSPINFKSLIILSIILLIGVILIASLINKPVIKEMPIIKNESSAIQIEYVTIMVTPTQDGKLYFASEYEEGVRKLHRPFSFFRPDVSGLKDLSAHVTIYDYRLFDYYTWFNPSDYKYYKQYPIDYKNKFLFIFAQFYIDDISGEDTRFWIPKDNSFAVQIQGVVYSPSDYPKQIRIQELENVYNLNDDYRVTGYNSKWVYSRSTEYLNSAGEKSDSIDVLKGGKSNAIDGYLIFEIPKGTAKEDITVLGNFHSFGSASWKLIS